MSRVDESFGAVPKRLAGDLYAGELSWEEFAVLAWLELSINYRVSPPVWSGTTRDMAKEMRWPYTVKHLGKVLRGLHARGWIESTANSRSPKAYTIRLLRGAARRTGSEPAPDWLQTGSGSGSVWSQSLAPGSQSEDSSIPHEQGDRGSAQLAPGASPQKQNSELEVTSIEVTSIELMSNDPATQQLIDDIIDGERERRR